MCKKIYYILFVLLVFTGCAKKIQAEYSAEVTLQSNDHDGTMTVRCFGYGNNNQTAISNAQKNALSVLMFKGLPGSELRVPLVDNENESKNSNPTYYKNLFENGYSNTFIISSDIISPLVDYNNTKRLIVNIKININSLRRDLETNKIIRKFGY
ncbi:MAG: hypothetical protein ACOYBS_08470 [Flavobacterium sp.]